MESSESSKTFTYSNKHQINLPKIIIKTTQNSLSKKRDIPRGSVCLNNPIKINIKRNSFCCISEINDTKNQQTWNHHKHSDTLQLIEWAKKSVSELKAESKKFKDIKEEIIHFDTSVCRSRGSLYLPDTVETDAHVKESFCVKNNEASEVIASIKKTVNELIKKIDSSEKKILENEKKNEMLIEEVKELRSKLEKNNLFIEETHDNQCYVKCEIT